MHRIGSDWRFKASGSALLLALAAACGDGTADLQPVAGESQQYLTVKRAGDSSESESALVTASSPLAGSAIQLYGRSILQSPALTCATAAYADGAVTFMHPGTGRLITIAGAVSAGRIEHPTGVGALATAGAIATSRGFDYAAGVLGFFAGEVGSMPLTAADAEQRFDAAFGTATRNGQPFDKVLPQLRDRTKPRSFYRVQSFTTVIAGAPVAGIAVLGIIDVGGGKAIAVHTTGTGSMSTYVW